MAKKLERVFYALFGVLLILLVCVCMGKPQHNLIPLRIAMYTAVWLVILCLGRIALKLVKSKFALILSPKTLYLLGIIWGILLYIVGCISRSYPHTDYGNVYEAADAIAHGLEPDNWDYFSRCTNNRYIMLLLSGLLRVGYWLGMKEGFYFVLAFQVIHVVMTAWCIYYLAGCDNEYSVINSWTALMMMVLLTPIWGNIAFFYTDQMSFGYSIIAYTFLYIGTHSDVKRWRNILLVMFGGFIWGIAICIKITTVIPLIAVGIVYLLRKETRNKKKAFITFMGCFFASVAVGNIMIHSLPCEKNVFRDSDPVLYWVALGLNGDGSYAANEDFAMQCRAAENVEERNYLVKQKIKKDWVNFFSCEHLILKARRNFACGDLGASGYMTYPYRKGNFVYELISWDGKFFWKYACLSTSYIFALFILTAVGALRGATGKRYSSTVFCSYVAFFGIVLFLMLWEAQNKQMFNHSGWMVLAASYGLQEREKQKCKIGNCEIC